MTNRLKVLIVDDDPDVAALHSRLVDSQDGFVVCKVVHSGGDALAAVENHQPQIVVLDFGLPDIDGREVLRRMRASNSSAVEVIAVTAANDLDSVRYARSAGIHHYLVKPFAIDALRDRLNRVKAERQTLVFSKAEELEQESVDLILGGGRPPSKVSPLPKGLGPETLERVRETLSRETEAISAAEVARSIGASRVTARRYLDYLHQTGEIALEPKYGKGRPENRYRITGSAPGSH